MRAGLKAGGDARRAVLERSVDDAGPVGPRRYREAPGDRGGLEPADLLQPPDVQLQVRTPRSKGILATFRAPGEVAAQAGLSVIPGGAVEAGQLRCDRQPQLTGERHRMIGRDGWQLGEVLHAQRLRLLPVADEALGQVRQKRALPVRPARTFMWSTRARPGQSPVSG
jgi:hypothetical protein